MNMKSMQSCQMRINKILFDTINQDNLMLKYLLFGYSSNTLNIFSYIHVQIFKKMKKYVSKQDVEKGLVDPNKPLNEQKQYLDKIEKEDRQKTQHRPKNEHHQKRQRQNRPKYNWNRRDVTQQTPIPDVPKKQVPKPDKEKFYNELDAFKKQISKLHQEKTKLIEQFQSAMRNTSDNKKNSRNVKSKYSGLLGQKHTLKKNLQQQMKLLQQRRDELDRQLNQVKVKAGSLKKPQNFQDCSLEELQRRLEKTEHRLTTAELTKKQQNQINMRIQQIKRAMQKSRSQTEVNSEINKLQDQNQILYKQLKEVKGAISEKYALLKQVKGEIGKLNEELSQQKIEPEDTRTPQQIKADLDKKIGQLNEQKQKIKKSIDKLKQSHEKSQDQYQDYSDLMSYVKMVKQEKEKIANRKLEQERIKKEKEEAEKRRQQEYEQRQKRRQEKLKKDEQRRKQVQQRKQKLQKERQQFINRNPHHEKIDICKVLLDYCESLKPQNAVKNLVKREQKVAQPILELKPSDSKDWQKQLKKGAQVIAPKKLRQQEEAPKKIVKEKKKKEVSQTSSAFTHTIDTNRMFDRVNLIAPLTVTQIEDTIKQINQRIELFNKPSEEEIQSFKERAEREFDSLHGFDEQKGRRQYKQRSGEEREHHEEVKPRQVKERSRRSQKTEIVAGEKDFPGLN